MEDTSTCSFSVPACDGVGGAVAGLPGTEDLPGVPIATSMDHREAYCSITTGDECPTGDPAARTVAYV